MNAEVIEGSTLQYVLVKPPGFQPDGTWPLVVMLHGFGANMYDLANLSPTIDDSGYVYAFPNAPYALEGMGGNGFSWMLGRPGVIEPAQSGASVDELLDDYMAELMEATRPAAGDVVLGGFSQGAGLTLSYGLLRPETFKALIVLSGFFRDADTVRPRLPARRDQPIFLVHGRQDPIIPISQAHETRAFLEAEGYAPEYHEYDMPHSIPPDVVADLVPWLHKTVPPRAL